MSQINVDAIRHTSASSDAITLASNGKCAVTGSTVTADTGKFTNLPNRNLLYNGAMNVSQRASTATVGDTGYHVCDRWRVAIGGEDESVTVDKSALTSSDTPYSSGFRYATKITNGNQTSGAGATDYLTFTQRLEGQNINSSGWDYTSTSSKLTISFWIKSSVAQTFYSRFRVTEASADKEYVFAVAATTSWQKITKTIPGASGLNPVNTNAHGFSWDILLMYGTDYTGTMTVDQWNTVNTSAYVPDMTTTWWTTNDATFEITGVQLEVGDYSTDFEHLPYGVELDRCKRYFIADIADRYWYNGEGANVYDYQLISFPTTMRDTPDITFGTDITMTNVNTSGGTNGHGTYAITSTGWNYSPLASATGNITGKVNYTASAEL